MNLFSAMKVFLTVFLTEEKRKDTTRLFFHCCENKKMDGQAFSSLKVFFKLLFQEVNAAIFKLKTT